MKRQTYFLNQFYKESVDRQKVNEYIRLKNAFDRQARRGYNTMSR